MANDNLVNMGEWKGTKKLDKTPVRLRVSVCKTIQESAYEPYKLEIEADLMVEAHEYTTKFGELYDYLNKLLFSAIKIYCEENGVDHNKYNPM